jgi:hypothetical protein
MQTVEALTRTARDALSAAKMNAEPFHAKEAEKARFHLYTDAGAQLEPERSPDVYKFEYCKREAKRNNKPFPRKQTEPVATTMKKQLIIIDTALKESDRAHPLLIWTLYIDGYASPDMLCIKDQTQPRWILSALQKRKAVKDKQPAITMLAPTYLSLYLPEEREKTFTEISTPEETNPISIGNLIGVTTSKANARTTCTTTWAMITSLPNSEQLKFTVKCKKRHSPYTFLPRKSNVMR